MSNKLCYIVHQCL